MGGWGGLFVTNLTVSRVVRRACALSLTKQQAWTRSTAAATTRAPSRRGWSWPRSTTGSCTRDATSHVIMLLALGFRRRQAGDLSEPPARLLRIIPERRIELDSCFVRGKGVHADRRGCQRYRLFSVHCCAPDQACHFHSVPALVASVRCSCCVRCARSMYVFVGLERIGGWMCWDVSDPTAPVFQVGAPPVG